jgi:hypothetical protein
MAPKSDETFSLILRLLGAFITTVVRLMPAVSS